MLSFAFFLISDAKLQKTVCAHNFFNTFLSKRAFSLTEVKNKASGAAVSTRCMTFFINTDDAEPVVSHDAEQKKKGDKG